MTDLNLPHFEGNGVDAVALGFSGSIADESLQPLRALRLGQRVVLIGVGEISAVNHKTDKNGDVTRVHTVKMFEAYEVPASQAESLLDVARNNDPALTVTTGETDDDGDSEGEGTALAS